MSNPRYRPEGEATCLRWNDCESIGEACIGCKESGRWFKPSELTAMDAAVAEVTREREKWMVRAEADRAENTRLQQRIRLSGDIEADDRRLRDAEKRIWPEVSWGCDAPEHMADEILANRERIRELEEEAAKPIHHGCVERMKEIQAAAKIAVKEARAAALEGAAKEAKEFGALAEDVLMDQGPLTAIAAAQCMATAIYNRLMLMAHPPAEEHGEDTCALKEE